ncbi:hypothetical protein ISS30_07725 [bacterium]|nr:hypothetical protein [FCB group bacterium]MBL7191571.1 hypothetical protein [bacterium]
MALIVQKYGGAVLSNIEKIRRIAGYIAKLHSEGNQLVVVVSAMGYTTDDLVRLANSVSPNPSKREMDMLLSVGERITMSLLVMAIEATGLAKAISFTGSQVGIITDNQHTDAKILQIRGERLKQALEQGYVVVVAGFQGVSIDREITTLGRGGSDTTAVALGAALGADRCDLIKEVPGIFSGDPTIIPEAKPIPAIDFDHIRELSLGGARIAKADCIELAKRHNIEIRIGTVEQNSIVCQSPESAYFSLALKENLTLAKFPGDLPVDRFVRGLEYLIIGNQAVVFGDSLKMNEFLAVFTLQAKHIIQRPVHSITAVGISVESIPAYVKDMTDFKIEFLHLSSDRLKILFSGENPRALAQRIHEFIMKKPPVDSKR